MDSGSDRGTVVVTDRSRVEPRGGVFRGDKSETRDETGGQVGRPMKLLSLLSGGGSVCVGL